MIIYPYFVTLQEAEHKRVDEAAIIYADHRESSDHDHVVADLADRFEMVLDAVEADEGWATNRVSPGKVILGDVAGQMVSP